MSQGIPPRLLVATHNAGKLRELMKSLSGIPVEVDSLASIGVTLEVEETGRSFKENAVLKAKTYATASGMLTIADDSGLEVDALGGQPGVCTARYGGEGLTPEQRYLRLLEAMKDVPFERRSARFRAVVALALPGNLVGTAEGTCEGMIAMSPAGSVGFGYDPIFFFPDRGKTMAELSPESKSLVSHRGRAIRAILPLLLQELSAGSI
jgi:XTP/dITP diphosphohydrolase